MTFCISALYLLTKDIYEKAIALDLKMENNETSDLEEFPILFADRQSIIDELTLLMKEPDFEWTAEEREMARQLVALDNKLQPLLLGLYQAYKQQIERINQTKNMSVRYKNSYQNASVDGTFFDARK